ncbi:hypothetical protein MAR_006906 [Mya arenaria]|uniref:Uncharacterized protein n=1 Tax=Mya arenaria TaxID=6604 RepID=A0ABY7DDL1_MYAAR|nr:hypothetical protein MAR_006906 [Mya arenaria]
MQQVFSDPQVGPAVRFSETPTVLNHSPPTLGQHTDEVLSGVLQMNEEEIAKLHRDGSNAFHA